MNSSIIYVRYSIQGILRPSLGVKFHLESMFEVEKCQTLRPELKYKNNEIFYIFWTHIVRITIRHHDSLKLLWHDTPDFLNKKRLIFGQGLEFLKFG